MSEPAPVPASASVPTPASAPRSVRFATPVLLLVAIGSLAAAFLLPVPKHGPKPPTISEEAPQIVPAFTLTERNGQSVSNTDLLGKVWVASFVFTRCTGPCPSVTATMAKLQSELDLAHHPNLRLVTFTVDPTRDRPEELKKYAEHFRSDAEKWLFLTGTEPELHTLLHDGFKIAAARSQNPHPPAGQEFDHSTFLVLVDQSGTIRGYFDGYQGPHDETGEKYRESVNRLKTQVAKLLREQK